MTHKINLSVDNHDIVCENNCGNRSPYIHMTIEDAAVCGVVNGQHLILQIEADCPVVFENVKVDVSDGIKTAFCIDVDTAAACGCSNGTKVSVTGYRGISGYEKNTCENIVCKKIITEGDVIEAVRNRDRYILIGKKTIVTPLAKDTLREKNINLKFVG